MLNLFAEGQVAEREAQGIIKGLTCFGSMTYYDMKRNSAEAVLHISVRNTIGMLQLNADDAVRVEWSVESLVVLS
ncbi:MAG: hypothetical protein GDA53_00110 [Rhodobacteraceae bacterium]|nr:hypothetical protein [Paracoccaceae bacterium]